MYSIPENFDPEKLTSRVIEQISFTLNSVCLSIGRGDFICINNSFYLEERGINIFHEIFPVETDFGLLNLLEKKILRIEVSQNRKELLIFIENDSVLKLCNDDNYESYSIRLDNEDIIL